MLGNLNTTISSMYRDALAERLQTFILPKGVSIPLQQTKLTLSQRYPAELKAKAIEGITHTEEITENIGKILAKAIQLNPVIDEEGDRSPDHFQNNHYLGKFLEPLNRLLDGKQSEEVTKNQILRQTDLPKEFSRFLDETLPAIAKVAEARRNIITDLTENFVSTFKAVTQEHLGDYALSNLEKLDSLINQNLERIKNQSVNSEKHLEFNLDRYTGEFTQNNGRLSGLNIYIGVDNRRFPDIPESPQAKLLRDIAVNIHNNGFQVRDVSAELGQSFQDVYRISIPIEQPSLPRVTLN